MTLVEAEKHMMLRLKDKSILLNANEPTCFVVVREWIFKSGYYERIVSAFSDRWKAEKFCLDDINCYSPDIIRQWELSWTIYERFIENFLMIDDLNRTLTYIKLDMTTYKRLCPPRIRSVKKPVYDLHT